MKQKKSKEIKKYLKKIIRNKKNYQIKQKMTLQPNFNHQMKMNWIKINTIKIIYNKLLKYKNLLDLNCNEKD